MNATEIFDTFIHVSDLMHKSDKAKKLMQQITSNRRECGSCRYWMHSRACPREEHINGHNYGPSCSSPKCDKFEMSTSALGLEGRWQKELAALRGGE